MKIGDMTKLSLFVASSLVLYYIESFIPTPIAGIKIGLSNIGMLSAMLLMGFKEGMIVGIMKSLMASLFFGRAGGIIYSLPATLLSGIIMGFCIFILNKNRQILGPVGISVLGSAGFNFMQIFIASIVIADKSVLGILPYFFILSVFTGTFIGIVSGLLSERLEYND